MCTGHVQLAYGIDVQVGGGDAEEEEEELDEGVTMRTKMVLVTEEHLEGKSSPFSSFLAHIAQIPFTRISATHIYVRALPRALTRHRSQIRVYTFRSLGRYH